MKSSVGPIMAWPESQIGQSQVANGVREREFGSDNQRLKRRTSETVVPDGSVGMPETSTVSPNSSPLRRMGGKDVLSYAGILRSRNKFADALALYENVLEVEPRNAEALVGKGICLQQQGLSRQAFESFADALRLD
eukprot:c28336_g2_i1 orf=396-803(+)